jgi:hypothetical protein
MVTNTLTRLVAKLATRRGERPEEWGARRRSAQEIADWMAQHGWKCSLGTVQHWIDGHQQPHPAAQVLLNLMAQELSKKARK